MFMMSITLMAPIALNLHQIHTSNLFSFSLSSTDMSTPVALTFAKHFSEFTVHIRCVFIELKKKKKMNNCGDDVWIHIPNSVYA